MAGQIICFAERMGFEPMIPFWGIHTFQACAIDQLGHLSNVFQLKNFYPLSY